MATTNPLTVDGNTVGLWHMDGTAGAAGKKADASSNALNLTENSSPTAATGQIIPTANGAYGTTAGSSVSAATNAVMNVSNLTIEGWINTSSTNVGMCHRYTGVANRMFRIFIDAGSKLNVVFYDNTDGNRTTLTSATSVATGAWVYFAVTYDGTTKKIYINPSSTAVDASAADTFTMASATSNFIIGAGNAVETGNPTGSWDEFRYSSSARTGTEVYNYYNNINLGDNFQMGAEF